MSCLSVRHTPLLAVLLAAVVTPAPWGLRPAVGQPPAGKPPATQPDTPPEGPPSPLDLVRGLREQGMADLALEYLKDIEGKPLSPEVKAAIPLERAKCQLEAADDEPDEGTRLTLVAEAKDGFATFLKHNPNHPRAAEASLALARLTSLEAKAQLAKARRTDLPDADGPDRDEAIARRKADAARARPLFAAAAAQFKTAADRLEAKLKDEKLDPTARRALEAERADAELARGVNQFALADTYLHPTAAEQKERADQIDKARDVFVKLADGEETSRTVWVARAWMGECEYEKVNAKAGEAEFKRVLAANIPAAEDGKRMVRFFQLQRKFLEAYGANSLPELQTARAMAEDWLRQYGHLRRARNEAAATRWYLAVNLQRQAAAQVVWSKDKPPKLVSVPATAQGLLTRAEQQYRILSQSDTEYAHRAARRRMEVVRLLLGEADKPPTDYRTFEECQMAALIQMGKLLDLEKDPAGKEAEIRDRRVRVVRLLERARELATEKDSPADVADVHLRLIYFYELTDQPYQAAVLGEHVARTMKAPGGKAAAAGSLGLVGYGGAMAQIRVTDADAIAAARKVDRDRAIGLARFLDERFPNDAATDRARHQLAALLYEDGKPVEAYDALLKVRAGYDQIAVVRLFQGAVAAQLLGPKDSPLPEGRRVEVFRRTVADLDRVAKPPPGASAADARSFVSVRCRLAALYLLQPRVDAEAEKTDPGYAKALKIADEALGLVPTFDALVRVDSGTKLPTLDGWEARLLAEDVRTRAAFLQGQVFYVAGKHDEVFAVIGPVLGQMKETGPFVEAVKKAAMPADTPPADKDPEKKDIGKKDAGKKEPEKKGPEKKEPEKKEPETKEPGDEMPADDPGAAVQGRVATLAASVDKLRRDLIVLGLKARVRQGKVDQASELLDLLKKFGGSIETSIPVLQQLSAELAAQILSLRRAGKHDEAKVLTDGFAKLLDKISAEPNLPPGVQLFVGQALIIVGEYDKAADALRRVPTPPEAALNKPLADLNDPTKTDPAQRQAVMEYRRATLELIRAFRLHKKFPEADALLKHVMGSSDKPRWAYSSLEFRKEVAYLFEDRGANEQNRQLALQLWGEAQREWTALATLARRRLEQPPPKGPGGEVDNQAVLRNKNAFYEAFFDANRCVVKANLQLLQGNPKLQRTFDDVAKKFVDIEKASQPEGGGSDMTAEVRAKYHGLLEEVPELKKAYQAAGGKLFLEPPAGAM